VVVAALAVVEVVVATVVVMRVVARAVRFALRFLVVVTRFLRGVARCNPGAAWAATNDDTERCGTRAGAPGAEINAELVRARTALTASAHLRTPSDRRPNRRPIRGSCRGSCRRCLRPCWFTRTTLEVACPYRHHSTADTHERCSRNLHRCLVAHLMGRLVRSSPLTRSIGAPPLGGTIPTELHFRR
jgi:hypothetical protein